MIDKKLRVLVFPAGTEIALEIHNALKNCKFIELIGATSVPCHASYVFKHMINGYLPFADDPSFIPHLRALLDVCKIDYIYPAHDSALYTLTLHQDKLPVPVVTSALETVEICRSKMLTYKFLREKNAWYLPKVFKNRTLVTEYPVFVKPSVGQGSDGAQIARSREELDLIMDNATKEYVICEYLPGEEITVDCFTDRTGKLRYVGERTRERIRAGIAVRSKMLYPRDPKIYKIAQDLHQAFRFNGAWFFQMKLDKNDEWKLLEVAPRIAGTMGLTRNLGVNMPLLTMYNMLGKDVEIISNDEEIALDRAFISRFRHDIEYDTVYIDFDDTIVQKGKVNPMVIAYLYQADAKGKRIILLTRHNGNIYDDLEKYHIDPLLFDAVISVNNRIKKVDYIAKYDRAIFIDDSFSERMAVAYELGIPVFDVDMVESLIDWRA